MSQFLQLASKHGESPEGLIKANVEMFEQNEKPKLEIINRWVHILTVHHFHRIKAEVGEPYREEEYSYYYATAVYFKMWNILQDLDQPPDDEINYSREDIPKGALFNDVDLVFYGTVRLMQRFATKQMNTKYVLDNLAFFEYVAPSVSPYLLAHAYQFLKVVNFESTYSFIDFPGNVDGPRFSPHMFPETRFTTSDLVLTKGRTDKTTGRKIEDDAIDRYMTRHSYPGRGCSWKTWSFYFVYCCMNGHKLQSLGFPIEIYAAPHFKPFIKLLTGFTEQEITNKLQLYDVDSSSHLSQWLSSLRYNRNEEYPYGQSPLKEWILEYLSRFQRRGE